MSPRLVGIALVALVFTNCGPTSASVCRDQCDKRAACGTTLDISQCHTACGSSPDTRAAACVDADIAWQQCLVKLPCDQYLSAAGCQTELSAVTSACR